MARSTPSTAFTHPILRRQSAPMLTGKYFRTFSSSSNGAGISLLCPLIDEPAFCGPIRADRSVYRLLRRAPRHRVRAARVEGAASGQISEVGRLAGNRKKWLLAAELWHRPEQSLRIGMLCVAEQVAHGTLLDDLARIHDRHPVTHFRDDTEIVRDKDQRDPALLLDVF